MEKDYQELIAETIAYIQDEMETKKDLLSTSPELKSFFTPPRFKIPDAPALNDPPPPVLPSPKPIPPVPKPPIPPPRIEEEKEEEVKKTPAPIPTQDEMRSLVGQAFPHLKLRSEVPSDEQAVRLANAWKEQESAASVSLLYFGENSKELHFLKQVAKAIEMLGKSAQVVAAKRLEREKKWDLFLQAPQLKWIIAVDTLLKESPELKRFYRENAATSEKFLNKTPLILIAPLSFYFKNPLAKRSLWKMLSSLLSS